MRAEDAAAEPPVAPQVPADEAGAIIAQLRQEAELANRRAVEATQDRDARVKAANETVEAVRQEALKHIDAAQKERDAALVVSGERLAERKQATAVATAVTVGLFQKLASEMARIVSWVPALGSLFGGWWLFNSSVSNPSTPTLIALGLYGAVVVAPAAFLTLKGAE